MICIGNLSVGGTGKSPMTAFLVSFLSKEYQVAVLSRGYGRKSKGFFEVLETSDSDEVGDEPLQLKKNYPNIRVAVCEDRQKGIERLLPDVEVILLDDAFQHRKVTPSFSLLLTSFSNLYIHDNMLPAGDLREPKKGAKRANMIVVTKCPEKVSYASLQEIEFKLQVQPNQKLYFSKIRYEDFIVGSTENLPLSYLKDKPFTLVTGIADASPLVLFLKEKGFTFIHEKFADHHNFSEKEIESLKKHDLIITTEKDFMRLQPRLQKLALYYLPIKIEILKNQESFFKQTIKDVVASFYKHL